MKRGRTASHVGAFDSRRTDTDASAISMICARGTVIGALECAETQTKQVPLARSSCGCSRCTCTACNPTNSARKTTHTGTTQRRQSRDGRAIDIALRCPTLIVEF
jgi:hypothetical protein